MPVVVSANNNGVVKEESEALALELNHGGVEIVELDNSDDTGNKEVMLVNGNEVLVSDPQPFLGLPALGSLAGTIFGGQWNIFVFISIRSCKTILLLSKNRIKYGAMHSAAI